MRSKAEGAPRPTLEEPHKPEQTAGSEFLALAGKVVGLKAVSLIERQEAYRAVADALPHALNTLKPNSVYPNVAGIVQERLNLDAEDAQREIERLGQEFPKRLEELLREFGLTDVVIPSSKPEAVPAPTSPEPTTPEPTPAEIPDWVKEALEDKGPLMFEGEEISLRSKLNRNSSVVKIMRVMVRTSEARMVMQSTLLDVLHSGVPTEVAKNRLNAELTPVKMRFKDARLQVVNPVSHGDRGLGVEARYYLVRKPKNDQPVFPEGNGEGSGPVNAGLVPAEPVAGSLPIEAVGGRRYRYHRREGIEEQERLGGNEGDRGIIGTTPLRQGFEGQASIMGRRNGEGVEGREGQGGIGGMDEGSAPKEDIIFSPAPPFLQITEPPANGSNGPVLEQGGVVFEAGGLQLDNGDVSISEKEGIINLSPQERWVLAFAAGNIGQLVLLRETERLIPQEARARLKKISEKLMLGVTPPQTQEERDEVILSAADKIATHKNILAEEALRDDDAFLLSLFSGTKRKPEDVFFDIVKKISSPAERIKEATDDYILALAILLRADISKPILKKYKINLDEKDILKINNIAEPISQQRRKMAAKDMDQEVIPAFIEGMLRLSPLARREFLDHCPNKARSLFNFLRGVDGESFGFLMMELYEACLSDGDLQPVEKTVSYNSRGTELFSNQILR